MVHNLTGNYFSFLVCILMISLGFDGHLILKQIDEWDKYHIVPKNSEKVSGISISKFVKMPPTAMDIYSGKDEGRDGTISFVFKDTMTFLGGSLDKNTKKLCESSHQFPFLRQSHLCKTNGVFDQEKFDLLLQKGQYPYDHIQSFSDLNSKTFPSKDKFHSCLGVGRDISDKDWRHGMDVWNTFQCQSMLDYR